MWNQFCDWGRIISGSVSIREWLGRSGEGDGQQIPPLPFGQGRNDRFYFWGRGGATEQAAERVVNTAKGDPQALKRTLIFSDLAARLKVVPFPKPGQPEFFRNL